MDLEHYLVCWVEDPLIRITGLLSMVLFILPMLLKSDQNLKAGLALGNLLAVYHLWALGSPVAACLSFVAFIRLGLAALINPTSNYAIFLALLFSALYFLAGLLLFRGPLDFFALTATMINTWAIFLFSGLRLRAALAIAMCLWVLFDFGVGAYEMAVASFLSALAALYAWRRELSAHFKHPSDTQNQHP